MLMKIRDKIFVVTGAGSGMGRELTIQLLGKQGYVAAVDINQKGLEQTFEIAGASEGRLKTFVLDITDKTGIEQFSKEVKLHFGAVDGLINNAGIIQPFKVVNDLSAEEIERVFNVNFFGTLNMTKIFLPLFLSRPEAHIINVSSMGGFLPVPGQSLYGAAKAAVKLFTEALSAELRETNVKVTIVFPGAIATNIMENSGLETPKSNGDSSMKALPADKAAAQIISAIETNKTRVFVGRDSYFLDKLYRLSPQYAINLIAKMIKGHVDM